MNEQEKKIENIIMFLEHEINLNAFTNQIRLAYVVLEAIDNKEKFEKLHNRMFLKHVFRTYQSITYDYETTYGAFERSVYRYIKDLATDDFVDFHATIERFVKKYQEK